MKTLDEIAKEMGKQLLRENYSVSVNPNDIEMYENPELIETVNGESFFGLALIKNMPISDFKKNRNGRLYSYDEWHENIYGAKKKERSYCFADHPKDSGSTTKIGGIWINGRINEQTQKVVADLIVANNENGRTILFCAKNGLFEVSTSGFGNVTDEGMVKDFILARHGDHVIFSSNYSAIINKDVTIEENVKNKTEQKKESFKENVTNYKDSDNNNKENNNNIKEILEESINMEEKSFHKSNVKNLINVKLNESLQNGNFEQGISLLSTLDVPEDLNSVKENAILILQNKLTEKISNSAKENEDLKETIKVLEDKIVVSEEKINKIDNIFKDNDMTLDEMVTSYEILSKDMAEVEKLFESELFKTREITELTDIQEVVEINEKLDKNLGLLLKEKAKTDKEIVETTEMFVTRTDQLKEAEDRIEALEKVLKEDFNYIFEAKAKEDDKKDDGKEDMAKEDEGDGGKEAKKDDEEKPKKKDESVVDDDVKEDIEETATSTYKFKSARIEEEEKQLKEAVEKKNKVEEKIKTVGSKKVEEKTKIESFFDAKVKNCQALEALREAVMRLSTLKEASEMIDLFVGGDSNSVEHIKVNESNNSKNVFRDEEGRAL